ncbi:hypothetical protein ACN28I_00060 [Archangium gephyra]|uniref:hypothetical protein n=1 Tax=Archangium gephyra TaxID=48 RepID=UPI003B7DB3C8
MDEVLQVMSKWLLLGRGDTPPRIAHYSGRGPPLAWVRIIGVRIVGELASQDERRDPSTSRRRRSRGCCWTTGRRSFLKEDSRQALVTALRTALRHARAGAGPVAPAPHPWPHHGPARDDVRPAPAPASRAG